MPLTLSTGDVVTFRPKFTHKADKAYTINNAKDLPDAERQELALEQTLLVVIESVGGKDPTVEWLESLPLEDYYKLTAQLVELRKAVNLEAVKKNS